jgi:hypothetical protein
VSDALWERIEPLIPACPPHPKGGQPVASDICSLPLCLYRALVSSGMPCPKSVELAAPSMTVFAGGEEKGFFQSLWQAELAEYDELAGIG